MGFSMKEYSHSHILSTYQNTVEKSTPVKGLSA